jgi:hypothetical protein
MAYTEKTFSKNCIGHGSKGLTIITLSPEVVGGSIGDLAD